MKTYTILIKIILCILLFLCLLNMPYGFFQFVRFFTLIGFVFLAYESYKQGIKSFAFFYIALAILFQPIIKISLGRAIWNIVDVIVGLALIVSIFYKQRSK